MKTNGKIILETSRTSLRELTILDTAFILELLNSTGWLKFIGDRNVRTEEQAENYLLNGPLKSYKENGYGLYLVELRTSHTPIGMCGLLKREYLDSPDIGFAFLPEHTEKGYGFEIVKALINYTKHTLNIPSIMAITLPTNTASIGLLKKAGFKFLRNIHSPTGEELMLFGFQE